MKNETAAKALLKLGKPGTDIYYENDADIQACQDRLNSALYPRLIVEDKDGFEKSIFTFLSTVKNSVKAIIPLYNSLQFSEPFSDEVWKKMCSNTNAILTMYLKKVQDMEDLLGVNAGIVDPSVINRNHPSVNQIASTLQNLHQGVTSNNSSPRLNPVDVVDVTSEPRLTDEAYQRHLEAYRFYVNNGLEQSIKTELDNFAKSYSRFVTFLNDLGYGPYVGSIYQSYLQNFYDENQDLKLETNPTAWGFLAGFVNKNNHKQ